MGYRNVQVIPFLRQPLILVLYPILMFLQSDGIYSICKVLIMSGLHMRAKAAERQSKAVEQQFRTLDALGMSDVESEPQTDLVMGPSRCSCSLTGLFVMTQLRILLNH